MFDFRNWLVTEDQHKFSCVMAVFENPGPVVNWAKQNIEKKDLCEEEGGLEEEIHITALYGLHCKEPSEVRKLLKTVRPFEIKLGKVSKFESQKYDVLKLDVESKELVKINTLLKTLDFTSNHPNYIPHCTLAYVNKGACKNLVGNKHFEGKTVKFKELVFSSPDREKTKIRLT